MIQGWPLVGLMLACLPAKAAACRLALVLAMDVSSSVDEAEDRLQRAGLAAALIAPEVQAAFLQSPEPVALAVFEWSGRYNQAMLLDWVMIRSAQDLLASATILGHSKRSTTEFPTALGHAMGYAVTLLRRAPECMAHTIDVSGDGRNNEGFTPHQAYAHFPFSGVTVNGLAIETSGTTNAPETGENVSITDYYWKNLLHGPGAFVEVAQGFEDFERALRRKLERELGSAVFSGLEKQP